MPVASTSTPAPRKYRIYKLEIWVLCTVPKCGEIRDQTNIPKQKRDRGICRHRKNVPDQRTAKLRPDPHHVRIGEKPISGEPSPSCANKAKNGSVSNREKRHRLGETVDGSSPLLIKK